MNEYAVEAMNDMVAERAQEMLRNGEFDDMIRERIVEGEFDDVVEERMWRLSNAVGA